MKMQEGAAGETTTKIVCYACPNNVQIKLYDLPGVGTLSKPIKSYMHEMDFKQFDFVLIVSSNRFLENDRLIIEELRRLQKHFYLVRSNVAYAVENQKKTQTRDEVLDNIRKDCFLNLQKIGIKAKDVFLIDSHVHNDFDLGRLQTSLVRDAPDAFKTSLILTFRNTTKDVITEKMKILKRRVRFVAFKALLFAVPGAKYLFNVDVITEEVSFYKEQLGLDDKALGKACVVLEADMQKLKQLMSYDFIDSPDDVLRILKNSTGGNYFQRIGSQMFDIMEGVLKGIMQDYPAVYNGLCEILEKLEKVSFQVSENVLDKLQGSTLL